MQFLKKYWYICFGVFALLPLVLHTAFCISKARKQKKISFAQANALHRKSQWQFFLLGLFVVGPPTILAQLLFFDAQSPFLRSLSGRLFFLFSILAAYLYVRWRQKHIGHFCPQKT